MNYWYIWILQEYMPHMKYNSPYQVQTLLPTANQPQLVDVTVFDFKKQLLTQHWPLNRRHHHCYHSLPNNSCDQVFLFAPAISAFTATPWFAPLSPVAMVDA